MASFGVSRHWRFMAFVFLLTLLILPRPSPATAAFCDQAILAYGGGRSSVSGFGGRSNLENTLDEFACVYDGSVAFVRVSSTDTNHGVAAGYSKRGGTYGTDAYMLWEESTGQQHEVYQNIAADGKVRLFQVLRDRTYDPDVVWIGEFYSPDGSNKYLIGKALNNMAYPKDRMVVYGQTVYTDDKFFGSSGDHANYSGFQSRGEDKVWYDRSLVCTKNLYGDSNYHVSCSEGSQISGFDTWDSRN